jgi:hypothetical protein
MLSQLRAGIDVACRSAVSDLVAPMRTPHVWIAAMRGFTPGMFMTRVRL